MGTVLYIVIATFLIGSLFLSYRKFMSEPRDEEPSKRDASTGLSVGPIKKEPLISEEDFVVTADDRETFEYRCGHKGLSRYSLVVRGVSYGTISATEGLIPWCPSCLRRGAILCGDCETPILPAEPVGMYVAGDNEHDWATRPPSSPRCVVNCITVGCGITGASFCGTWNGNDVDYAFRDDKASA